jgi:hypothetical protein
MKSLIRAQMVFEDALVEQPKYSITLTTRSPTWQGERYMDGKRQLLRKLRSEFGRVEVLEFMEQTTGKAPRSGGHRRGHGHNLVKADVSGAVLDLERLIAEEWRRTMGAWQIAVSELRSAGGAVAYLTLNLALEKGKAVQAPTGLPKGTRTLRPTRGYWSLPPDELRARARDHHALRRLRHSILMSLSEDSPAVRNGAVNEDFLDIATEVEWERQKSRTWTLVSEATGYEIEPRRAQAQGIEMKAGKLVNLATGEVWQRSGAERLLSGGGVMPLAH